ncbi:nicotinate-nucleotide adenylyltransferase [Pirellulales bacterium]|nr:nicotinate-nucleotide adenylyltransferase [Pirellulales bacterium]
MNPIIVGLPDCVTRPTPSQPPANPTDAGVAAGERTTMRLGIFGGTFDPVHHGHLSVARCCFEQLRLDEVRFIPAAHQPHKSAAPRASADDRLAMIRLAIAENPYLMVSDREVRRGGRSFTVDTLRAVSAEGPDADLYLLLGADSLADLPNWKEAAEICRLAIPAVVRRPGVPEPDPSILQSLVSEARLREIQAAVVDMPEQDVSSSEIREQIAADRAWRDFVPGPTAEYIEQHGLYRPDSSATED